MSSTIIIIAVGYIAITALVLKIFRFVRDRNITESEYHNDKNLEAAGRIALHPEQHIKQRSNKRYA